jgi:hypothetical protein
MGDLLRDDVNAGHFPSVKISLTVPKPDRPRALPEELEPVLIDFYRLGYGYRSIFRILRNHYHINPDFSSVKRALKRPKILHHYGSPSEFSPY